MSYTLIQIIRYACMYYTIYTVHITYVVYVIRTYNFAPDNPFPFPLLSLLSKENRFLLLLAFFLLLSFPFSLSFSFSSSSSTKTNTVCPMGSNSLEEDEPASLARLSASAWLATNLSPVSLRRPTMKPFSGEPERLNSTV